MRNDIKIAETALFLLKNKNWNDLSLEEIKKNQKFKNLIN
jgi:hypothetical protein